MTPNDFYSILDSNGVKYELVEIFEGVRVIRVFVQENLEGETDELES